MTYNARSESVAEKPSFRHAWKSKQFCIIPVEAIFEPNYESGKAVRWMVRREDGEAFGLAGIWEHRQADDGPLRWTFSMLTINADEHPLMKRFHKPEDEKRSVVILPPEAWEGWLGCPDEFDAREKLLTLNDSQMQAAPSPRK